MTVGNLYRAVALAAVVLAAGAASGHELEHAGHPLGQVDFPVSCSQDAQAEFNRALALLHHMTYPQAREAFERVSASPRSACSRRSKVTTAIRAKVLRRSGNR